MQFKLAQVCETLCRNVYFWRERERYLKCAIGDRCKKCDLICLFHFQFQQCLGLTRTTPPPAPSPPPLFESRPNPPSGVLIDKCNHCSQKGVDRKRQKKMPSPVEKQISSSFSFSYFIVFFRFFICLCSEVNWSLWTV